MCYDHSRTLLPDHALTFAHAYAGETGGGFRRAPEENVLLVLDCGAFTAEAAYPEHSFPARLVCTTYGCSLAMS